MKDKDKTKEKLINELKELQQQITELKKSRTKFKQVEEELELTHKKLLESRTKLIQSDKMSVIGTLTAGITHEMNNSLTGLLNFVQYCLKHTSSDDKLYIILQDAEREVRRCIAVVENLLTFSHLDKEGEKGRTKTNCTDILEDVFKLLSYRIMKEKVSVIKHYDAQVPTAWMNINNIQQVFLNVINNAVDALTESKEKEIKIDINHQGEFVRVTIADSGSGIAPEDIEKIFDPFFSTKPSGQGTGLGLYICNGIIKAHKGEITCESKLGAGTKFKILLPIDIRKRGGQNE